MALVVLAGREAVIPLKVQRDRLPSALLEEGRRLQLSVTQLKAAIRRNREQLHDAKSRLVQLEARCRELGIRLIVQE
jgi:hypothetical protein